MNELVVGFDDIQKTLEPIFGGNNVKIVLEGNKATILLQAKPKKVLKARGILNEIADIDMIKGEKGAWEAAALEKHAKNSNS